MIQAARHITSRRCDSTSRWQRLDLPVWKESFETSAGEHDHAREFRHQVRPLAAPDLRVSLSQDQPERAERARSIRVGRGR